MHIETKCAFQVFALALLFVSASADVFTSLGQMTRLVEAQAQVTNYLKEFISFQAEKLEDSRTLLKDFDFITENANKDPENFVGNPINAVLLIKKLTKDLQNFISSLNTYSTFSAGVEQIREKVLLPSDSDYKGSIEAILRLEDTYLLDPEEIAKGNFSKKHVSRPLNAFECFEIGRVAYENGDFYHAVRWLSVALKVLEKEGDNPSVKLFDVLDYLAFSTSQQGNKYHALKLTKRLVGLDPNHQRIRANLVHYEKELAKQIAERNASDADLNDVYKFKNERKIYWHAPERTAYEKLCRGETLDISEKRKSQLSCRYINYHPLLKIAPVKEELVYDDPPIWVYHDVITEKQIEIMKQLGFPKLQRAYVRSPITGRLETAQYRISQSGWLGDDEHPIFPYLSALVTAITNMTMDTAETWQIANYGLGGQYEPHYDFTRQTEPPGGYDPAKGNRIATWLYYLESPEVGGATVFTDIGARVNPIRRSAAFWYNLFPSGNGDKRTRHAACPVLLGTKWVSNKWIHIIGQEFTRPCDLQKEPFDEF